MVSCTNEPKLLLILIRLVLKYITIEIRNRGQGSRDATPLNLTMLGVITNLSINKRTIRERKCPCFSYEGTAWHEEKGTRARRSTVH